MELSSLNERAVLADAGGGQELGLQPAAVSQTRSYRRSFAFMAGALILLLAIDRLSKAWVQNNMEIGTSIAIVPDFLRLAFYVNRGAASGFGQHWPMTAPILAVAGAIFIPVLLLIYRQYTLSRGESFWIRVFLVTGLAAIISTVVDRFQFGYVVDFISVRSLPIFNFADTLPFVGALALGAELVTGFWSRSIFGRKRERADY